MAWDGMVERARRKWGRELNAGEVEGWRKFCEFYCVFGRDGRLDPGITMKM